MTTTTIDTQIDQIKAEYGVTDEQLSKCNLIQDGSTGRYFYIVESQTTQGTEYTVKFNAHFGKLTCRCKAGNLGIDCWHKRASVADFAIQKLQARARCQREVAAIIATPEFHEEYSDFQLEQAKANVREARAVAKYGDKAYEREELRRDAQGRLLR